MNPDKAFSKLCELQKLESQKEALYKELHRSMLIADAFPGVFGAGKVSIKWITHIVLNGAEVINFGTLTDGNGNEYELTSAFAEELGITVEELKKDKEDNGNSNE